MLAAIRYRYLKSRIVDTCNEAFGNLFTFYEENLKLYVMVCRYLKHHL